MMKILALKIHIASSTRVCPSVDALKGEELPLHSLHRCSFFFYFCLPLGIQSAENHGRKWMDTTSLDFDMDSQRNNITGSTKCSHRYPSIVSRPCYSHAGLLPYSGINDTNNEASDAEMLDNTSTRAPLVISRYSQALSGAFIHERYRLYVIE